MSTPSFDPQPCCGDAVAAFADMFTSVGLCLGDGTPIGVINRRVSGVVVQDGWVNLLTGAFSAGSPPVGTTACGGALNIQTSDVLCDITGGTGAVNGLVLIEYHYNPDGSIASTSIIDATTGAPYVPVGTVTVCPTDTGVPDNDMQVLCDRQPDGTLVPLVRDYHRDVTGTINGFTDYTLAGAPYTATGTVGSCVPRVSTSEVLCDSTPTRFLRTYTYGPTGAVQNFFDTTLAGVPFVPVGAVGSCATVLASADLDFVEEVLCDATPTSFIRRFTINSATGAVTGVADFTLAGGAFTPVPPVAVCSTGGPDFDFVEEILCDSNGTQFIRRFTFNSVTGAVTATTDLTLAGGAFAPVGAVGICAPVGTTNVHIVDEPVDVNVLGTTNVHIVDEPVDVTVVNPITVTGPVSATVAGSTAAAPTLTTATAVGPGATVDYVDAKSSVSLFVRVNGTVTAGVVRLEASQDNLNWVKIADTAMLATGVNQELSFSGGAFRWFRGSIAETVTGGGTVTATLMFA